MQPQTPDIFTYIDKIVGWLTPILAIIASLAIYIYRDKVRSLAKNIEDDKKESKDGMDASEKRLKEMLEKEAQYRKEDIEAILLKIKDMDTNYKEAIAELSLAFKEGIKEERNFRNEVMVQHSNNIEKLFGKLDEVSIKIGKLDQKMESHIENQKRICIINHHNKNI